MSLKPYFCNSYELESSHARQRTCPEPNFEFHVPFLTADQTWVTLTNSGDTVWTFSTLKFYVSSTTAYRPPPHHSTSKYDITCAERNALRHTYVVPKFEFHVPFLPIIPTWLIVSLLMNYIFGAPV